MMSGRNPHDEFIDALHELDESSESFNDYTQVMWRLEYLTSDGRQLQYYGIHRDGQRSTAAHVLGDSEDFDQCLDPDKMPFAMLGFIRNVSIVPYMGKAMNLHGILADIERPQIEMPEITKISIEKRGKSDGGRNRVVVTNVAYLGFRNLISLDEREAIASALEISPHWCRERHYLQSLKSEVYPSAEIDARL